MNMEKLLREKCDETLTITDKKGIIREMERHHVLCGGIDGFEIMRIFKIKRNQYAYYYTC